VTASPNAAVRAEPRSLGSARARDPLAREVRLLGALLGQVLAEQEGAPALELVERVRERTIALRRGGDPAVRAALDAELASLDTHEIAILARAFSTYFRLVNLAEEKERVRQLRRRARAAGRTPLDDTFDEAVAVLHRPPYGPAADLARADGAPDGGPAADRAGRAAADLRPPGPPGRPAPDACR
jgi:phosphoenolpyruvate carboxylase